MFLRVVTIDNTMGNGSCGCQAKSNVVPSVMSEPVFAIAEGDGSESIFGCGSCGDNFDRTPTPRALQFETWRRGSSGYEPTVTHTHELSERLQAICEEGAACLPWVRVQRDPQRFGQCLARARNIGQVVNSHKIYEIVKGPMRKEDQEVFYVILLDTQMFVRGVSEIARGARDRVQAPIPDVLRLPLVEGATAFAIAHNHPSGRCKPSDADRQLTVHIREAAKQVDLFFIDHIVVGGFGQPPYYSFADNNDVLG